MPLEDTIEENEKRQKGIRYPVASVEDEFGLQSQTDFIGPKCFHALGTCITPWMLLSEAVTE